LLVGAYAGAGFGLVPWALKKYLPQFVQEKLERKAVIAEVEFNPFKWHLKVRGFKFTEANGSPLASFDEATVDVDASSLTHWALVFSEIHLAKPVVNVELAKDGKLNWLAVIDKLNEGKPPNNEPPPRLLIEHLKIKEGRVDFHDRKAEYTNALSPIDFELSNFSTLPNHRGPYALAANIAQGGVVKWRGEASANPIEGKGEFALENISIPDIAAWLKVLPGADVKSGRFAARLPYQFAYADAKVTFAVDGAEAGVTELDIKRKGGESMLKLAAATVGKIKANINTREVTVDGMKLSGGHVSAARGADGRLDWNNALGKPPAAAANADTPLNTRTDASEASNTAFKLAIKDIALDKFSFKFDDALNGAAMSVQTGESSLHASLTANMNDGALGATLDSIKLNVQQLAYKAGAQTAQIARIDVQTGLKLQSQAGVLNADLDSIVIRVGQMAYAGGGYGAQVASADVQSALKAQSNAGALNATLGHTKLTVNQIAVQWPGEGGAASLSVGTVAAQTAARIAGPAINITGAQATVSNAAMTQNGQSRIKLAQAGVSNVNVDMNARAITLDRAFAAGLQVQVGIDDKGEVDLLALAPAPTSAATSGAAAPRPAGAPWKVTLKSTDFSRGEARFTHKPLGITVHAQAIEARTGILSSDLKQPIPFKAGFSLKEGGTFAAQGSAHAGQRTVDANVEVAQLPLALAQPLLAQQVKLKLASGTVSTQGRFTAAADGAFKYLGGASVDDLKLVEDNGDLFASWKSVAATQMSVSLKPNLAEIAELRITDPNAKLLIEADRSLNAQRLLVNAPPAAAQLPARPDAKPEPTAAAKPAVKPNAAPSAPAAAPAGVAFPVSIGRIRVQNGYLDFADLSLRPQFAAKIHELNGVITGLSTAKNTRSQIELDGRVDEFGLARIRGELNPFVPRDNTDVTMIFRNVDLVSASPYSMKFAGYRIAGGKISLDLQYKIRNSQMLGENKIVLDQLTLGERVDSPDAVRLPLELAIAILKDSDGKIDLGLPVSGSLDDPQFSYGAVIWKALVNVLTRIVTAPFRALGSLFGGSGEKLESIDFDPGSARLLPPEREKLKSVAQVLAKRPQLKLAVPAQYSEAADSAALRERALRAEVSQKTGGKVSADGPVDPINVQERAVRTVLRDMYAARFGKAEYERVKAEAEKGAAKPAVDGKDTASLPIWRRAINLAQGEPQMADAGAFYETLIERLRKTQPIPDGAVRDLGKARSDAITAALKADGIDSTRVAQPAGENVAAGVNKLVPLKLGLSAR
jgi:hypothetical protein